MQVTSDQPGAQQMTIAFANNNLNGKSRWRAAEFRDYDSTRTRVCVTVGMMTTGYDCEDLLNVVLARPIFSPTDFIQIKGRGTRLFTFQHGDGATAKSAAKDGFALFDFFANCEFFEEEFDYDRKIDLPKEPTTTNGESGGSVLSRYTNTSPDPIAAVAHDPVGSDGMKIDREMFRERFATQARDAAAKHPELGAAVLAEDWPSAEALAQKLLFERPKDFWNLLKLRTVFQTDRQPGLREILQFVFGVTDRIATREQLVSEHFERFLSARAIDVTKTRELRHLFNAFVLDGYARQLVESGDFAQLRAHDANLMQCIKRVGADGLKNVRDYVRAEVTLETFERAS